MIHPAAVALVHQDYVHPGSQAVARDSQHVLRIRRSLKTMNCNDGERILPATGLPVAQASDLNSGRDLNQAVFGLRQMNFASRQETGDGLHMATTQPSARLEKITRPPGLRRIQTGIALVRICL